MLCPSSSLHSLPYDRSKSSCKATSPESVIQCFLFKFPVTSPFINLNQQLITSSSFSFHHFHLAIYLSFSNVFQKAVPIQVVTGPVNVPYFIVGRLFLYPSPLSYFFIFYPIGPNYFLHPSPALLFKTFQVFLIYLSVQISSPYEDALRMQNFASFFLKLASNLLLKQSFSC